MRSGLMRGRSECSVNPGESALTSKKVVDMRPICVICIASTNVLSRANSTAQSEALWRSWLARRPVTAEVAGSSPVRVAKDDRRIRFTGCAGGLRAR